MSEGVRSTHVRALLRGLGAVELPVDELARAVGISDDVLADPDQFVPATTVYALWERAVACDPSPDLGLRVGAAVPAGAFDVYDYLLPACANVGDAMHAIARLHRLATTVSRFVVAPLGERTVRVESVLLVPGARIHPQGRDYVFSAQVHRLRRIDPRMGPAAIELRGPAKASRDRYAALLHAEVSFDHKASALIFSRETWERPIAGADATLRAILERHALHLASRAPSPALVDHARTALAAMISEGLADIATLARRLGTSPRTLQRKLEAEGVAYSDLLDQARRELACAYLADPALSVDEVAALTGYSEASAFSRAFRRWTGTSPLRYRRGR